MAAAGARVPDEMVVIAHTNFPYPTPAAVPVVRLGFAIDDLLATCFARLEQQRRGETAPALTLLPAMFENEVKQPSLTTSGVTEGVRI